MKKNEWLIRWQMEWKWDYGEMKPKLYLVLLFHQKRKDKTKGIIYSYKLPVEHQYVLVHHDERDVFEDVSLTYNQQTYLSTVDHPLPYPEIRKQIWHSIRLDIVTKGDFPSQPLFCEDCGVKQPDTDRIDVDFQEEILGEICTGNPCFFCRHEEWDAASFQETVCQKRNIQKIHDLGYDEFVSYAILVQQMQWSKEGRDKNKKA